VTGRWTGRGLCLTGRVRSLLSACACLGILIGRGGASSHDRPDASGRCGCLLDSNRTLALWRPVHLAARSVADSLERCSGLTGASGRASCVGGVRPTRPVSYGTSASGRASRVRSVRPARPVNATVAVSSD
jgi:hypothetical protein